MPPSKAPLFSLGVGEVLPMQLPTSLNAPARTTPCSPLSTPIVCRSPKASTPSFSTPKSRSTPIPSPLAASPNDPVTTNNRPSASILASLKDLKMLASACNRAERYNDELSTRLKIGVILDNHQKFDCSIKEYETCLMLAEHLSDKQYQSIALNCLAVTYCKYAFHLLKSQKNLQENRAQSIINFERSLDCSRQQLAIFDTFDVDDSMISQEVNTTLFFANTNTGVVLMQMDKANEALGFLNTALDNALSLENQTYERLASGNLALCYFALKKYTEVRLCYQRFVQLTMPCHSSSSVVDDVMTRVSLVEGDYEEAQGLLVKSLNRSGTPSRVSAVIKSGIGLTRGLSLAQEKLSRLSESFGGL
ncbi:hypothetical protein RCL1_007414 [Eukaryota sp. TZLM3-RCL]